MEHPVVTRLNNYGYLEDEKVVKGYFGEDIYIESDSYIEYDGDIFLEDNLEDYLKKIGFIFYK